MTKEEASQSFPDQLTELTAISPLDGRYWEETHELAPFASEMALIQTRVEVESKYLIGLSNVGLVRPLNDQEREVLTNLGPTMTLEQAARVKEIESTTRHDVKAMERVMREMVGGSSLADVTEMIHFGLTSEDVNNISYRLMLDRAKNEVCVPALDQVVDGLVVRAEEYKGQPMLARTHGQAAVPTTVGKELANFAYRLNRQVRKVSDMKLTGKLNGAVGNYNALAFAAPEVDWISFSKDFIESLGLEANLYTTQINTHEDMIEMFQGFQRINGVLIDFDQDMWRYISDDWFVQEVKKGEVGSSTMPQKVNPIRFENSEGNLGIANSLYAGMIQKLPTSRLQRDLSDSTVVRNIGVAMGHGLLAYKNTLGGLGRVRPNIPEIDAALHENWTILTEGVQTVLRRSGETDPYSMVSTLSRGQKIGPEEWQEWVSSLPIADELKAQFNHLTPESYIGYAEKLTELAIEEINSSKHQNTSL